MSILQTKLFTPAISDVIIPRPRLIEQIEFDKRLTLISAPAGFGKTILAAWSLITQKNWQSCWLSLEATDNDLSRFLIYFIAALQTVDRQIGRTLVLDLKKGIPFVDTMSTLINDVVQSGLKIVLVLDDYHLIEDDQIHQAMAFLLKHLPPQWHLIMTTRADPPLPTARLRARGQMTELRASDIRFTPIESERFLNGRMGLDLSSDDIKQLEARTEGWIAGLQLAAIALQSNTGDRHDAIVNFAGDDRYVIDYLVSDVLERLSQETQQFLYQTSILDHLCASLCDAVRASVGSEVFLRELEQSNLFLFPLDNQRRWYRYHQLFADLLRFHLVGQTPSAAILYDRASVWFEQNEMFEEAVEYAFSSENNDRVARLIEQNAHQLFSDGKIMVVHRWLMQLPTGFVAAHPDLYLVRGLILYRIGENQALSSHLKNLPRALTRPQMGELASLLAHDAFWHGDFSRALHLIDEALAAVDEKNLALRMPMVTLSAWCYEARGDVEAAIGIHQQTRQMAKMSGSLTGSVASLGKLAMLNARLGRDEVAITCFEQALRIAEKNNATRMPLLGMAFIGAGQAQRDIGMLEKGIKMCGQWGGLRVEAMYGYRALFSILQQQGKPATLAKARADVQQFVSGSQLPAWVVTLLEADVPLKKSALVDYLTKREREVLGWMAQGLTVPQISAELIISPSTIRTHIKRIYAKLGAHSRHEALQIARQHKLIT